MSSVSPNSLNPVARVAAVAGAFLAMGAVALGATTGAASAASVADQKERATNISSAHAVTQNPTLVAGRSQSAVFFMALPADLSLAAQPGNQPAAIDLAKQTCDALPTWGAQKDRMTAEVSEFMGQAMSADQLKAFAGAASLGFCPGQFPNVAR